MDRNFPQLKPFSENGLAGFRGYLRGPRRVYGVLISAAIPDYPQEPPKVFMDPHTGHHWYSDGSLCYHPDGWQWDPARDTMAMAILVASKYLEEFD
jgi:ubiquitin-protein ligase